MNPIMASAPEAHTHTHPTPPRPGQAAPRNGEVGNALGVSLIVGYKLGKAAVQGVAAVALAVATAAGATQRLHAYAAVLREHVVAPWSLAVARALFQLTSPAHLRLLIAALVLDAALSLFEGWALHRRYWWASWLIVIATGSLLPFELVELFRVPRLSRLAILAVNLTVVIYLGRRTARGRG